MEDPNFKPLDLPSLPKKNVTEAKIVPTILLRKGYTFHVNAFGKVTMVGPGIRATELCAGVYNLWFLLQWIEWSAGKPVTQVNDFSILEKLGSGTTVGIGHSSCDRTSSVYRPHSTGDYWSFSDSGLSKCGGWSLVAVPFRGLAQFSTFGHDNLPSTPGIWKRLMDCDTLEERRVWRQALESSGFCYYRHPTTPVLYFSNASNVMQGYPPTADLLGYPKLSLEQPDVYPDWCDQEYLSEELARFSEWSLHDDSDTCSSEEDTSCSDSESEFYDVSEPGDEEVEQEDQQSRLLAGLLVTRSSGSEQEDDGQ